ncbi:MAG: hypothetical protein ACXWQO_10280 [Bdellovibrionota bacterium]
MFRTLIILFLLFFCPPSWAAEPAFARQTFRGAFTPSEKKVRVAIFDADQTLRLSTTQYRAPRHPSEVLILPGVKERILQLNREGFFVAIMSNQQNPVKDTGIEAINLTMNESLRLIETSGAQINYVDFSVTEDDAKPSPLMFERLEKNIREKFGADYSIDRDSSFMVGDAAYIRPTPGVSPGELKPDGTHGVDTSNFDRKFAENSGIRFYEPQEFFSWEKNGITRFNNLSDLRKYTENEAQKNLASCPEGYRLLLH